MGFERIVAYFYRYVNQRQEENCGFVRLERRDHILKVRMDVRCPRNDLETASIYLLKEDGTSLTAVLLGEGTIKNGRLSVTFQTDAENILDSGESFQDSVGMLVECGRSNFCVANWKNKAVDTSRIKKVEKASKEDVKEQEVQESVVVETEAEEAKVEEIKPEEPKLEETLASANDSKEIDAEELEVKETVNTETDLKESKAEEPAVLETLSPESDSKEQETVDAGETGIKIQEEKNWESGFDDVRWGQLCKQCPRINAFRYEGQGDYVKAELKDLWYLPKYEWGLANNSFLLHGYYNYRYLLLGKVGDEEFVIGVPGRFYRRERDAAARFGFHAFRPAAETSVREGQFGYWCRNVGTRRENCL